MKSKIKNPEMNQNIKISKKRRVLLKGLAGLPLMAGFGGTFIRNMIVKSSEAERIDGLEYTKLSDIRGDLPQGKLANLNISRLIMGCNQIGGWAHARDLKYANSLFKAYNTDQKVIETLHLSEQAGINTAFMVNAYYPVFQKYLKESSGKMQSVCQTYLLEKDFLGDIDKAADNGASALYIQGAYGDRYVREGKTDMLAKAIEHIKKKGYPAGMGAHSLEVIKACEKERLPVDFYVKTFHHDRYWSAHPMENRIEFSVDAERSDDHNKIHDNMFDLFPEQTMEYMKTITKPWIAFKVLAGGAIVPADGFRFAFENGADFICVGMFDFQVADNVNTAIDILANLNKRERNWYA
jgi:hypothetical protein